MADDDVRQAILVHVVHQDRHAGIAAEGQLGMPDPLTLVGLLRRLEPAAWEHEVDPAVGIHVASAHSVTTATGLGDDEVGELPGALPLGIADQPEDVHGRGGRHDFDDAIAIDVIEQVPLDGADFGHLVQRPEAFGALGILDPLEGLAEVATGYDVDPAVAVDVHGVIGEVVVVVVDALVLGDLVGHLVLGPFVPVGARDDVGGAIVVDVACRRRFVVVGPDALPLKDQERRSGRDSREHQDRQHRGCHVSHPHPAEWLRVRGARGRALSGGAAHARSAGGGLRSAAGRHWQGQRLTERGHWPETGDR